MFLLATIHNKILQDFYQELSDDKMKHEGTDSSVQQPFAIGWLTEGQATASR